MTGLGLLSSAAGEKLAAAQRLRAGHGRILSAALHKTSRRRQTTETRAAYLCVDRGRALGGRTEGTMDRPNEGTPGRERRTLRRSILYGLLGSAAVVAVVAARPIAAAVETGGGWHGLHGRWGGHGRGPEAMRDHVQVGVKWALRAVDATEDQQQKVSTILSAALEEAARLTDRHRENREAFAAGLAGATVDRAALEQARKAELELAEEASQLLVKALADAAEALTPEQRKGLLEHAHSFRRH
jgi:Spy/CpxP family protein refolding chaperone